MTYAVTNTDTTLRARQSKIEIASPSYLPISSLFLLTRVLEGCQNPTTTTTITSPNTAPSGSNWKWNVFLFKLSSHHHICIVNNIEGKMTECWLVNKESIFFLIFLCEEGKIIRSRLGVRLPSNSSFNREIAFLSQWLMKETCKQIKKSTRRMSSTKDCRSFKHSEMQ